MPQRLDRLERVSEAVPTGGPRHKLGNSFRPLGLTALASKRLSCHITGQRTRQAGRSPPLTALARGKCHRLWAVARTAHGVRWPRTDERFPYCRVLSVSRLPVHGRRICQSEHASKQWSGYLGHCWFRLVRRQQNARGGGPVPPSNPKEILKASKNLRPATEATIFCAPLRAQ